MNKIVSKNKTRTKAEQPRGPHFSLSENANSDDRARTDSPIISTTGLHRSFRKGQVSVPVLRGVDFAARQGEITAIIGQSGSGKTTLLHLLGTLDAPDAGEIYFEENRIDNLSVRGRDTLRNQYLGMIFQFYHLLPELTTLENVLSPMMIRFGLLKYWSQRKKIRQEATELLELVGLSHRLKHRTKELSGGEMQRVAIARALINKPRVLLADEPTGNLDEKTGSQVMNLLQSLNHQFKLTIVMVTHDTTIAKQAHRVVQLVEGRVNEI